MVQSTILTLPKKHLVYPAHKNCFQFLLGIKTVRRQIEDNALAEFWAIDNVYYMSTGNSEGLECV